MPALPPYIMEPIFEQFEALLPERVVHHPLGCPKPRRFSKACYISPRSTWPRST
jgi:hypothetical protein